MARAILSALFALSVMAYPQPEEQSQPSVINNTISTSDYNSTGLSAGQPPFEIRVKAQLDKLNVTSSSIRTITLVPRGVKTSKLKTQFTDFVVDVYNKKDGKFYVTHNGDAVNAWTDLLIAPDQGWGEHLAWKWPDRHSEFGDMLSKGIAQLKKLGIEAKDFLCVWIEKPYEDWEQDGQLWWGFRPAEGNRFWIGDQDASVEEEIEPRRKRKKPNEPDEPDESDSPDPRSDRPSSDDDMETPSLNNVHSVEKQNVEVIAS